LVTDGLVRAGGGVKMKKLAILFLLLICLSNLFIGCSASNPVSSPNALVPSIMVDDTLFYMSQLNKTSNIDINESDSLNRTISEVSLSQWPTKNGQSNWCPVGSPYLRHENGIIVYWNEKWVLFITEEERLVETQKGQ